MTPHARSQSPSAPIAAQSRPAWQRLMGASATALLAVSPIQRLESIETQLDIKMAQAIRHNDAEAFESHLATIVSLHAAASSTPSPLASEPSAAINNATPPSAPHPPARRILNKRESSAPSLLSEADSSVPAAPIQRSVRGFL